MADKSPETHQSKREKRQAERAEKKENLQNEQTQTLEAYYRAEMDRDRLVGLREGEEAKPTPDLAYIEGFQRQIDALDRELEQISNYWAKNYSFLGFNAAYNKYKTERTVKGYTSPEQSSVEQAEAGSEDLMAFTGSFEQSQRERSNISIIQDFKEAGLSINDLLVPGPKQKQAILIALPLTEAKKLWEGLKDNSAEATKQLKDLFTRLEQSFKAVEVFNLDLNQFDEERVTQKIGEKFNKVLESAMENPIPSLIGLGILTGLAYGLWNNVLGEKGKKWAMGLAGVGAAGWAINFVPSLYRDDGKTLLQARAYDHDQKVFGGVTNELKRAIGKITGENENAFQALMHLKNVPASTLLDAYESALADDPENRKIDGSVFGVPSSKTPMNARANFDAVEAMMIYIAQKRGVSGDKDYKARMGDAIMRREFNSNGKDVQLQYIVANEYLGIEPPAKTNPDGSAASGSVAEAGLVGRGLKTPDSNGLERAFKGFGEEVDISHDKDDGYLFNDYPLTVKTESKGGRTSYTIDDPADSSAHWELMPAAGDRDLQAQNLIAHVAKKVNEGFNNTFYDKPSIQAKYPGVELVYSKGRHRWEVMMKDPRTNTLVDFRYLNPVNGILKATFKPRLYITPGVNGYVQLRMETVENGTVTPDEGNYASIDQALDQTLENGVHAKVKEDMAFVMGDLPFKITTPISFLLFDLSGNTVVPIEYYGYKGEVLYKNGVLVSHKLDANCPELKKQWETLSAQEAAQFLGDQAAQQGFTELKAAYEGQQHAGGLMSVDGWKAYITQGYERLTGGTRASYRSQETEWFETSALQMRELDTMMRYDLVALYKSNPTYNTYLAHKDATGSGTFAKAALKIGQLRAEADKIANRPNPDASNIDSNRQREMEAIRESNYMNDSFKGLMKFVNAELAKPGWDAVGDEDLATARRIKDYIRWKIFDLAYPIPQLQETALTADHRAWMGNLQSKFKIVLAVAQMDPDSAGFFGFDRRYAEATFDKALDGKGIKQFEKMYPNSQAPIVGGVEIPTVSPTLTIGVDSLDITNVIQDAGKRIDKAFHFAEEKSRNPMSEDDLVLEMRKSRIKRNMGEDIREEYARNKPDSVSKIEKIVTDYEKAAKIEDTKHSPLTLLESEQLLAVDMLDRGEKAAWTFSTKTAFLYLSGNFKHETYNVVPQPEFLVELMTLYYEKIDYGHSVNDRTPAWDNTSPEGYTNYFLTQIYNCLGGDTDVSIEEFYKRPDEFIYNNDGTSMLAKRARLQQIKPYEVWKNNPELPPKLLELDLEAAKQAAEAAKAEQLEEDRTEAKEKFMDWFDDAAALGEWTAYDGAWPEIFEGHVKGRLGEVADTATDRADLNVKLGQFRHYIEAEAGLYALLIKSDVDPTALEAVRNVIEPMYRSHWNRGATAQAYGQSLYAEFNRQYPTMVKKEPLYDTIMKYANLKALFVGPPEPGKSGELWEGWVPFF